MKATHRRGNWKIVHTSEKILATPLICCKNNVLKSRVREHKIFVFELAWNLYYISNVSEGCPKTKMITTVKIAQIKAIMFVSKEGLTFPKNFDSNISDF